MRDGARVLVSGAGVAGLTVAIALGRAGVRADVVERAPDVRADGYIISLSHHAYRHADRLGLLRDLRGVEAGIRSSGYYDAGGRCLLELNYERLFAGVDVLQIARSDLQSVLNVAARDVSDLRFGTTIRTLSQDPGGVDVRFADGREARYDAVIGTDGVHSHTRALAFAPEAARARPLGLWAAAYRLPNVLGLERRFETYMERDRYTVAFTGREGDIAAVFVWTGDEADVPPAGARIELLARMYADAPATVRGILAACPPQASVYMDTLRQIEMPRWHTGRVALAGDAAHCLTLFSGQGASAAFSGACTLANSLLGCPSPASAFAAYEAAMRPAIEPLQRRTRAAARWYVPRSDWRELARNTGMRVLPVKLFERHFQRKYRSV